MDVNSFGPNLDLERKAFEYQKYGRAPHPLYAAHPVLEGRGPPLPESYSEPSSPNSNVSV